ncbi:Ig-like domain-containing protein [Vibrio fluvialis]|uniref:Ig-like domain-containing protein n=1 Tax=Vibrio fluvialis TaxID=676 RepID=UPI0023808B58|nr:Ig-like domain-containing protein [Vibrio fluvialis]WDY54281.1 Ig-like domain-containing protein [Vibrio fluvialis]
MTTKKAGSAGSTVYNGVHGNLSADALEIALDAVKADDLYHICDYPVGTEINQIKVFNDAIGAGHTVQFFVSDKNAVNTALTHEIEVQDAGSVNLEGINFYIGDSGPVGLYMIVSPTEEVENITIEFPDISKSWQTSKQTGASIVSISLRANVVKLVPTAKTFITATYEPSDPDTKMVRYTSSDDAIAIVDNDGRVTGVSEGLATITAKDYFTGVMGTVDLSVVSREELPVTAIALKVEPATIQEGESAQVSLLAAIPSGSAVTTLTYSSSDPAIATVTSKGQVAALSPGEVTITVKDEGSNVSKDVTLTIEAMDGALTALSIDYPALVDSKLVQGESAAADIHTTPSNFDKSGAEFSSSNTDVVTVGKSTGQLTAVAPGAATISCTIGAITATYELTITAPPVLITSQPSAASAPAGENVSFSVVAENVAAYEWQESSSDTNSQSFYDVTWLPNHNTATLGPWASDAESNGFYYRCKLTGLDGSTVYSEPGQLTVAAA